LRHILLPVLRWAWCRADCAREGADLLASLLPHYDAAQFVSGQVFVRLFFGEAYWRIGQLDNVEQTLQEGVELAIRIGAKFSAAAIRRVLGEIALQGNPREVIEPLAAQHFEASIAILQNIKADNELACAYAGSARLHERQGRSAEARDYFSRALQIFDRLRTLVEPDRVRAELAQLTARSDELDQ